MAFRSVAARASDAVNGLSGGCVIPQAGTHTLARTRRSVAQGAAAGDHGTHCGGSQQHQGEQAEPGHRSIHDTAEAFLSR